MSFKRKGFRLNENISFKRKTFRLKEKISFKRKTFRFNELEIFDHKSKNKMAPAALRTKHRIATHVRSDTGSNVTQANDIYTAHTLASRNAHYHPDSLNESGKSYTLRWPSILG
jgi:hypothetical protein